MRFKGKQQGLDPVIDLSHVVSSIVGPFVGCFIWVLVFDFIGDPRESSSTFWLTFPLILRTEMKWFMDLPIQF